MPHSLDAERYHRWLRIIARQGPDALTKLNAFLGYYSVATLHKHLKDEQIQPVRLILSHMQQYVETLHGPGAWSRPGLYMPVGSPDGTSTRKHSLPYPDNWYFKMLQEYLQGELGWTLNRFHNLLDTGDPDSAAPGESSAGGEVSGDRLTLSQARYRNALHGVNQLHAAEKLPLSAQEAINHIRARLISNSDLRLAFLRNRIGLDHRNEPFPPAYRSLLDDLPPPPDLPSVAELEEAIRGVLRHSIAEGAPASRVLTALRRVTQDLGAAIPHGIGKDAKGRVTVDI